MTAVGAEKREKAIVMKWRWVVARDKAQITLESRDYLELFFDRRINLLLSG